MSDSTVLLSKLKTALLCLIVFLFPLFFLPFTQEFFQTGKLYLLAFGSLALLLVSTGEFIISKKMVWQKRPFDNAVILLFVTAALSVLISSPNKIQAILNPYFGLVSLLSLTILYFYISREKKSHLVQLTAQASGFFLSLSTVFFFFKPFEKAKLSGDLQVFKNAFFSPLGTQLDQAIFLGIIALFTLVQILNKKEKKFLISSVIFFGANIIALSLTLFSLFKNNLVIFAPYSLSWFAAVETLKQPITAFFGVGIDNFSFMFTKVKDYAYNQSSLWQIYSFPQSHSTILHMITEAGILSLAAIAILFIQLFRSERKNTYGYLIPVSLFAVALLLPPSLPLFFVFFLILGIIAQGNGETNKGDFAIDTNGILPLYIGLILIPVVFMGASGFFLVKAYSAEHYFKRSADSLTKQNLKDVYENNRLAVVTNPYIERFRLNFAQVNMLIANNVASKALPKDAQDTQKAEEKLSEQDKQMISQAIQAAISEAKAAIALNSYSANNWANLAAVYRTIMGIVQGADSWTVSAYQRAIVLDPQNPIYRLDLGGVLFGLKSYDEAAKMFEQSIGIKPDYANSHYNYAWALYQKESYQLAASEMQNVVSLLDPKKDSADYKKAAADLEEFKKKLPKEEETKGTSGTQTPNKLALPTPAASPLEQKIQLPKEASPGAK